MKFLKKYEQHQKNSKVVSLYESLTSNLNSKEKESYNYILDIKGGNYNNISESTFTDIFDKVKSIARKGLLTATLFSTLMSTPGFSNTFNKLSDVEKTEIKSLVSSDTKNSTDVDYSKQTESESITVDLGNFFKSGKYKLSQQDKESILRKLDEVKTFISKNGGDVIVTIESSESRVPNRDAETGDRMGVKELATKRYQSAKEVLSELLGDSIKIESSIKVGGPSYKNDDVNQEKYSSHQYVKVTVKVNNDIWNLNKTESGAQATKANGYVGKTYTFPASKGSGTLKLLPGSIPDRCKLFVDGREVGDTGFFADKEHQYEEFNYVPLYVLSLTKIYNDNPNSDAIKGVELVNINSVEELNDLLLNDKGYNVYKDKANRAEINKPYLELINMVKKGPIKLALYNKTPKNLEFSLTDNDKEVVLKVYSPVEKTQFSVNVQGSSNR